MGAFFIEMTADFRGQDAEKRVVSDATMTTILEIMVLVCRKIDVLRFRRPIKRYALLALSALFLIIQFL